MSYVLSHQRNFGGASLRSLLEVKVTEGEGTKESMCREVVYLIDAHDGSTVYVIDPAAEIRVTDNR